MLFRDFFRPKLEREVVQAYMQKLPSRIEVSWEREDGFIVGTVTLDGQKIYTQGRNAKEFIHMVNDAVYVALEFKPEYIAAFHRAMDGYAPNKAAWAALNDQRVHESSFGIQTRQPSLVGA